LFQLKENIQMKSKLLA